MNNDGLKQRTKQFALRVIHMVEALPNNTSGQVLGRQVLRSATSVAANYRAACRAKSRTDFIAKMGAVEEEADESALWLELITDSGMLAAPKTDALHTDAGELTAIAVSSIKTARTRTSGASKASAVPHTATPQSALRTPQSP